MTPHARHRSRLARWLADTQGLADRIHAVGWDYVSPRCEERRHSHNATAMPKCPG